MAETDDPQNKNENPRPERSSNRSRGRRPWQNRTARTENRAPRPAPETSAGQPQEADANANAWKPLPPTTGAARPASSDQNRPRPDGSQNRPRRENTGGQNRPSQPDRSRNRTVQPADGAGSQPQNRFKNRPRKTDGGPAGQDGGQQQPRTKGRPHKPDGTPAGQQANTSQNQNRPRRPGNQNRQPGAPTAQGSNQPAGAQSGRTRRRPEGAQPRTSTRRTGSGQARSPRASFDRTDAGFYAPSVPIKARGGIRARTENGEFGKNWWAKRWLLAMERLMDGARLQRGRRYAKMGQVLSMNEENNGIVAKVQGSRPQPYKVTIRISPLSDEQWDQVLDVLADQAIFTAQLLAGEMPANIEEAFSTAGVSLFPARGGDLMTDCSCPDWANPCKHIAATHYILGDRFDEDPFLIFRMRGRDQEAILQGLRQRRAGQEEPAPEEPEPVEVVEPLDENIAHFWEIGPALESYSVNVQPPQVDLPLLKRLGQPDFARQFPLERELGPAYEAISQAALLLAFSDISREPPENGGEGS